MLTLIFFVVNLVCLSYKNFKMSQQIAGKIRFCILFNFLFDNPCLFQLVCFYFKSTAIYMYCLSACFNLFCGKFSLLHLQSICFQKGHQYSYIRLSSQFNFLCDKIVPASFTKVFASK